ncbi:MAG: hypothetical protein ACRDTJ_03985 [Pseudonocardiaceae bacterium]
MTARTDRPGAFGSSGIITIPEVTEEERHRARLTVVEKSATPADALAAPDMLGLLDGAS